MAKTKGLRIGSAPDTFMGGSHQKARELIEAGTIGRIVSGTIHVMSAGMEHWHPNPDFFFLPGAGPVLDLAPYYITNLVQLLGPVAQVVAMSSSPNTHRTIGSGPRAGEAIPVKTPTTVHALLRFANGTVISYGTSWDVKSHQHSHMELYGESGTLYVPDPNFFGGALHLATTDAEPTKQVIDHPLSKPNDGDFSNYRGVGLADMAAAIRKNRPHRCNNDLAAHVVEVMNAILNSGDTAHPIDIQSGCARPAPLSSEEAFALLSNRTV
jgi:predicted dehydrogenase